MVVQEWYNPQTGEEYGGTGIAPREGTGWVLGKSPQKRLAELRGDLERAERGAVNPPARWDQDIRGVRVFDGDAESFAQTAELLRRQIAELENAGPAGTSQPPSVFPEGGRMTKLPIYDHAQSPSVFPDGDRMTKLPGYRPGQAQPIQPPSQGTPYVEPQATDPQAARDAAYKKAMDAKQKDDRLRQMKQAFAVSMKQLYPNDWQQRVKQVYG